MNKMTRYLVISWVLELGSLSKRILFHVSWSLFESQYISFHGSYNLRISACVFYGSWSLYNSTLVLSSGDSFSYTGSFWYTISTPMTYCNIVEMLKAYELVIIFCQEIVGWFWYVGSVEEFACGTMHVCFWFVLLRYWCRNYEDTPTFFGYYATLERVVL